MESNHLTKYGLAMMTLWKKREGVLLSMMVILNRLLLIPAESVEPTSYSVHPISKDEIRNPVGLSSTRKDFLVRYFVSYPEDFTGPSRTHYATHGLSSDGDFSFIHPDKRIGSEFLGKRFIYPPAYYGQNRRLGSEFLGKRSDPFERFNEDGEEEYHYGISPVHAVKGSGGRLWLPIEVDGVVPEIHRSPKRSLGSEFLGKRSGDSDWDSSSSPYENVQPFHQTFRFRRSVVDDSEKSPIDTAKELSPELIGKRMGSEFLGKRMGSEFLGKRMGSEFLGKRMGSEFLGKRMGSEFLGKRMGSEFLGKRMGSEFLGKRMGSEFLGKRMGSEFLGKRMGSEFLGKRMGSEFLGKRMGSEFLGKRMGSEFLGKRMGSEFLGKRMGSEFLGKRMGSEFLGKRMGSEFLGKRMGSEFLGKRMGSEFLGKRKFDSEFLRKLRRLGVDYLGNRRIGSEFLGKRSGGVGSDLFGKRDESSSIEEINDSDGSERNGIGYQIQQNQQQFQQSNDREP